MPRFVILEHDHPHLHWDLMLEAGDTLRTWRLAEPPAPGKEIAAEALADHRKMYLDYEGPVSGNRGIVRRWDWGTYEANVDDSAVNGGEIVIRFEGGRLVGQAILRRVSTELWSLGFRTGSE